MHTFFCGRGGYSCVYLSVRAVCGSGVDGGANERRLLFLYGSVVEGCVEKKQNEDWRGFEPFLCIRMPSVEGHACSTPILSFLIRIFYLPLSWSAMASMEE